MSTAQTPTQHIPTKLDSSIKLVDEAQAKTNLLDQTMPSEQKMAKSAYFSLFRNRFSWINPKISRL